MGNKNKNVLICNFSKFLLKKKRHLLCTKKYTGTIVHTTEKDMPLKSLQANEQKHTARSQGNDKTDFKH